MTFVPSQYLSPSQPGRLHVAATVPGSLWGVMVAGRLWSLPADISPRQDPSLVRLAVASLFYPVLYMGVSWVITLNLWLRREPRG
jgi:hypothetical protein